MVGETKASASFCASSRRGLWWRYRCVVNGLVCPLDSPPDLQTKEDGARLLESGIIERRVQPDTGEEEVVPAVMYRLDPGFVTDDLGGTPDPQAN
jgi:hypothetical protein